MAVAVAVVPDRDAASLAVALGHDDAFDFGPELAGRFDEARLLVAEDRPRRLVRCALRIGRARPPFAGLGVAHEQEAAHAVFARVALPAGDRDIAEPAVAGAGRRHHHRILAVRHHVGGQQGVQRIENETIVRAVGGGFRDAAVAGVGANGRDRNVARRLFLQQQFGRLDHRIAVEAIAHAAFEDDVGDSHDRHALMVGHVVGDDGMVGALRHAARREVDGFVEAVMAERVDRAQVLEVQHGLARLELRGEHRSHRAQSRCFAPGRVSGRDRARRNSCTGRSSRGRGRCRRLPRCPTGCPSSGRTGSAA